MDSLPRIVVSFGHDPHAPPQCGIDDWRVNAAEARNSSPFDRNTDKVGEVAPATTNSLLQAFDRPGGQTSAIPRWDQLASSRREFPHLVFVLRTGSTEPGLSLSHWEMGANLYELDENIRQSCYAGQLSLTVDALAQHHLAIDLFVLQVLTRHQYALPRRNAASSDETFDHVLSLHEKLHDRSRPLPWADWVHTLDTWQWTLRLDPHASRALQIAALFHDIERLRTEAEARIEHLADNYQSFKQSHALASARMTSRLLSKILPALELRRVADLIAGSDQPGHDSQDREQVVLEEADSLSFFSRNSDGFIDYYGLPHARTKIRFTLARLGRTARERLHGIRLRADVRALVAAEGVSGPAEGPPTYSEATQPQSTPRLPLQPRPDVARPHFESSVQHSAIGQHKDPNA